MTLFNMAIMTSQAGPADSGAENIKLANEALLAACR
jgi:hypothetical protein